MKTLAKILTILVIVALSDIHWGVMKTIIWVQMTRDAIAASEPVLESIRSTVSGEKRCPRCVQMEKHEEKSRGLDRRYQWEGKTSLASEKRSPIILPPLSPLGEVAAIDFPFPLSRNDEPLPFPPWA